MCNLQPEIWMPFYSSHYGMQEDFKKNRIAANVRVYDIINTVTVRYSLCNAQTRKT
jgi:hypothetical protein